MSKLTSRKFLISLAAFLGSIATTIAGFTVDNEGITIIGILCATLSAAIYAACEAMVDKAAVDISTTETTAESEETDNG